MNVSIFQSLSQQIELWSAVCKWYYALHFTIYGCKTHFVRVCVRLWFPFIPSSMWEVSVHFSKKFEYIRNCMCSPFYWWAHRFLDELFWPWAAPLLPLVSFAFVYLTDFGGESKINQSIQSSCYFCKHLAIFYVPSSQEEEKKKCPLWSGQSFVHLRTNAWIIW